MRKLLVFIGAVLVVYFVFVRNKHEPKVVQATEAEETEESEFETEKISPEFKSSSELNTKNLNKNSNTDNAKPSFTMSDEPLKADSNQGSSVPYGIENDRQISDIDATYVPPVFLKGTSAITAKYIHISQVLKNVTISDIQTTFARGIPLTEFISEGLKIPRKYSVSVHFDDWERKYLEGEMFFKADYATVPLQGQLSLQITEGENKVEKSCDAAKVGPLRSLKVLPEENSVLLFEACDKSFYLQLFYGGKHDFRGNYYERVDGVFKRTGEAMVASKFDD